MEVVPGLSDHVSPFYVPLMFFFVYYIYALEIFKAIGYNYKYKQIKA